MTSTKMNSSNCKAKEKDDNRFVDNDHMYIRAFQIECVLRTLSDALDKIKSSIILPHIFENAKDLPRILGGTKYEKVIPMVNAYIECNNEFKTTPLLDMKLLRIYDYFQENHKIFKQFPDLTNQFENNENKLITSFESFYSIAEEQLHKSAKLELSKERKLEQMQIESNSIKLEIIDLKKKLFKEKLNFRWKLAAKQVYLQKFENDLAAKRWQNNLRIQREITKCTSQIRQNHTITMERQSELEEELQTTKNEYEKAFKTNLSREQEARTEKNRLLLQLRNIIKKYDQTIGDKVRENIQLQEEHDEMKKKIDDFMVIYNQEATLYTEIVRKRDEEERLQQQRRVVLFMMNRAARIIQRYWRSWQKWRRKKAKKGKDKKGKKKK